LQAAGGNLPRRLDWILSAWGKRTPKKSLLGIGTLEKARKSSPYDRGGDNKPVNWQGVLSFRYGSDEGNGRNFYAGRMYYSIGLPGSLGAENGELMPKKYGLSHYV